MKSAYTALFAATLSNAIKVESEIENLLSSSPDALVEEPLEILEREDGSFSLYSPYCDATVFRGHTDDYYEVSVTDYGDTIVENGCVNVQMWLPVVVPEQCEYYIDIDENALDEC